MTPLSTYIFILELPLVSLDVYISGYLPLYHNPIEVKLEDHRNAQDHVMLTSSFTTFLRVVYKAQFIVLTEDKTWQRC